MRYTVRKSVIDLVGYIWMPNIRGAQRLTLSDHQLNALRARAADRYHPTRDEVEVWLNLNFGDFRCIEDWSASLEIGKETLDYPWGTEEGELAYGECMWPAEDEAKGGLR